MRSIDPSEVLIAIIHTRQSPWEDIAEYGQFPTWIPDAVTQGFKIIYFTGEKPGKLSKKVDQFVESMRWHHGANISSCRNVVNKILAKPFQKKIPKVRQSYNSRAPQGVDFFEAQITDLYAMMRWKQLALFSHFIQKTNFNYLIVVTSASYLQPLVMLHALEVLEEDILYAGPLHGGPDNKFVSGAQTVVNRKFAQLALKNIEKIPTELLNDIGLGVLASRIGVKPLALPTINIGSIEELDKYEDSEIKNNYHFRLKAINPSSGARQDVEVFNKLHTRLNDLRELKYF